MEPYRALRALQSLTTPLKSLRKASQSYTEPCNALQGPTEIHHALQSLTEPWKPLQSLTERYKALQKALQSPMEPTLTKLYEALQSLTPDFSNCSTDPHRSLQNLMNFTKLYRTAQSLTKPSRTLGKYHKALQSPTEP